MHALRYRLGDDGGLVRAAGSTRHVSMRSKPLGDIALRLVLESSPTGRTQHRQH
jgi:hypothetical protein